MELIAAVMHAPTSNDRFNSAKALLNWGFANWALTPVYPDQAIPPVPVLLGQASTVQPVLDGPCTLLLEKSKAGSVTTQLTLADSVEAPVEAGQKLGEIAVYVDGAPAATLDLVAPEGVARLSVGDLFRDLLSTLFLHPEG